ncbi:restriction endonuclease subunit S [Acinetobacter baumannii]|uniref:Restriction endonuclease subunit S n=8 Tax=Acinetobacter baumannii TaxID=470 RepID=A0AAD2U258_ACIBA|nr:restriction endonuclease subunit S [Acinetobacter baumannii]EHZ6832392.1 restriction endonuclease subunit S [Acinetobacter baumannii]EHZ7475359.1 restriction endonuclease subunit S [Acinetobacter baumannii]EHZ7940321.1 restriction endonuclease subunit S [Acinetobacter baumannii]EHZ8844458.1 restriction endonuclease subunit S [Acinetobacter baumannii]EIT1515165.1 restriction endonuclease subunit S [Acinetobacter baumannii]
MSLVFKELGELVDFKGGGTPSRNVEEYWGNSIPWATVKDLNEGITLTETQEFISELGLKNSASNLIAKGTIIIPTRMALGKVVISEIDVAINQDLKAVFVKDKETLDVKYLLRFLESNKENIASMGKGATVKGITLDQLKAIKIPLQPLAEQRRIAAILDKADELRQKRQQVIEKLDQLLQATFIDMFGDPVSNPKGWDVYKLKSLTSKIGSGSTPKGGDSSYKNDGISLIRSLNIYDGEFSYKNLAFIDQEQANKLKNVILQPNDVLLNITGASVARCCIVPKEVLPARVNQHVSILRIKENAIPEFLEALLISKPMKLHLLKISGAGATREALTKLQLQELEIIVPPLEIQNEFLLKLKIIKSLININLKQLNELDNLFISIQNQAFSGTL